jgi:hypothetical protein
MVFRTTVPSGAAQGSDSPPLGQSQIHRDPSESVGPSDLQVLHLLRQGLIFGLELQLMCLLSENPWKTRLENWVTWF